MIGLSHYSSIRNCYCFAYFGLVPEYLVQLRILRPILSQSRPDIELFIACRDEFAFLLEDEPNVITFSSFPANSHRFAYVRQISTNVDGEHSIYTIALESLKEPVQIPASPRTGSRCLVCPDAALPTRSLSSTKEAKAYAESKGYSVQVVGSDIHNGKTPVDCRPSGADKLKLVRQSDWVIGPENEFLFEAVRLGIKTTLMPTGRGHELYRILCPKGEILKR